MGWKVYKVPIDHKQAIEAIMKGYDADEAAELVPRDQWTYMACFEEVNDVGLFVDALYMPDGYTAIYTIREEKE